MDLGNSWEVLKEVELDLLEGVDMVMVKLVLFYMDIIWCIKEMINLLVVVYNVFGEYFMVKVVVLNGWIDE